MVGRREEIGRRTASHEEAYNNSQRTLAYD
jgi:hypothetical protein